MSQILDLRKKIKIDITPKEPPKDHPKNDTTISVAQPKPVSTQISWEAPSFYYNPQKRQLSLIIIALAVGGGGMLFYNKDTLTAIFLILSSLVLILYSNKRPQISKITINQIGVAVGDNLYYYKDLRSFWIHYDPGTIKELSLEPKRWYVPYTKVSIENINPMSIRSLLINFVPEREHEHSLVDILGRKMGL